MKISFFKLRKPRTFEYKPRYYDEAKERRKEAEGKGQSRISPMDLQTKWRRNSRLNTANVRQRSTMRLLIILIVLLTAVYAIFF